MRGKKGKPTVLARIFAWDYRLLSLFKEEGFSFPEIHAQFLKTWLQGNKEAREFLRGAGDEEIRAFVKECADGKGKG